MNETTPYFYVKNLMGDICEIVDKNGNTVASYYYDAWGNMLNSEGDATILQFNPFTYRGYIYDSETKLYYLQTRYYNPEWNRFINADTNLDTQTSIIGTNVFAYCDNNPVMKVDSTGRSVDLSSLTEEQSGQLFIELLRCLTGLHRHGGVITDIQIDVHKWVITAVVANVIMSATTALVVGIAASIAAGLLCISELVVSFKAAVQAIVTKAGIPGLMIKTFISKFFNLSTKELYEKLNIFSNVIPGVYIYGTIVVFEDVSHGKYITQYTHIYNFIFGPYGTSLNYFYYRYEEGATVHV